PTALGRPSGSDGAAPATLTPVGGLDPAAATPPGSGFDSGAALATPFRTPGGPAPRERVEATGPGVVQPSLVLGLGQMGRVVIDLLKQDLQNRYGPLAGLPHLEIYPLNTDAALPPPPGDSPLVGSEDLVLLKLNRPSRYVRPKDTMPPVSDWLDINVLYRMPRNLASAGIRALGRLAYMEHSRSLGARIGRDLEFIASEQALQV